MRAFGKAFLGAAAVWACDIQLAHAQVTQKWPEVAPFERGSGHYLNWIKIAVCWLLFLVWIATCDWVNADCQRRRFSYAKWNSLVVFPFLVAYILTWVIPVFWLGLPLLLIAYAVPLWMYIVYRNNLVPPHEQVMTGDHLRYVFAVRLNALGFKIEAERKSEHEKGPPVQLSARGAATDRDDKANLLVARQSPAYTLTRELVYDTLSRRAESVMLDYTQQAVAVRYEIDGVWHNGESRDRESGDAILAVVKQISALNPAERRARQEGTFGVEYEGKTKLTCRVVSQGTKTGERALLRFDDGTNKLNKLPDLGMRDKLQEQLLELLSQPKGFILISAPPRGGLTTTFNAAIRSADRYVRAWAAVEDSTANEATIENLPVTPYDPTAGQTPDSVLPTLIRTYPDVLVVRNLPNAETVQLLCDQFEQNRLVIGSIRARDCAEALLRVLMLKVPPARFAPVVTGILNQRLIRKLCETCKDPMPHPQVLQQLRLPANKIEAFIAPSNRTGVPRLRWAGLRGTHRHLRIARRQRRRARSVGQNPQARPAAGRWAQSGFSHIAGRRSAAGRQRHHFVARAHACAQGITWHEATQHDLTRSGRQKMGMLFNLLMALIVVGVFASLMSESLWSNAILLINVVTAALLATNFFEPVANWLESSVPSGAYFWDIIALWILFAVTLGLLRALTDNVSKTSVKFKKPVETAGRYFFALWIGWVLLCFTMMSLHTAPLSRNFMFQAFRPEDRLFFGLGPDRQWLGFMQKMSRTTYSRMASELHPEGHVFDPQAAFMPKYASRREAYGATDTFTGQ